MRILPKEVSRFDIPLCRMVYMPLVCPTLVHDIKNLEAEFIHRYRLGAPLFYVSIINKHGDERFVKDVDTSNWDLHSTLVNNEFEAKLTSNPHLYFFVVICFSFVMGTIGSRRGQVKLTGCTKMTLSDITLWTTSALIPRARKAC